MSQPAYPPPSEGQYPPPSQGYPAPQGGYAPPPGQQPGYAPPPGPPAGYPPPQGKMPSVLYLTVLFLQGRNLYVPDFYHPRATNACVTDGVVQTNNTWYICSV